MDVVCLVETLMFYIYEIQKTLCFVYQLTLFLGHLVISVVTETYQMCHRIIITSSIIIRILIEDFEIFKSDLLYLCKPYLNNLKYFVNIFIEVSSSMQLIFKVVLDAIKPFYNIYQNLLICCEMLLYLTIDVLQSTGQIFIDAIYYLRLVLSIESWLRLYNSSIQYATNILFKRHEVLMGLFVIVCLAITTLKYEIHMKLANFTKIFLLSLATIMSNIYFLILMFLSAALTFLKTTIYQYTFDNFNLLTRKKSTFSNLGVHDLESLLAQEMAEKLCIICMDRKRNTMLLQCQHLIICNICVSSLLQNSAVCPVCRKIISDVMMVYT